MYFLFINEWEKGHLVYTEVVNTSTFKTMSTSIVETYNTIGAHLYFYFKNKNKATNLNFNLHRYINNIQIYHKKDKTGVNATLVLIEILYYYMEEKFEELLNRRDTIFIYKHRYLTEKHTKRINIVFGTLIRLIDKNFESTAKQKIITKAQAKLKKTPFWGNYEELEIVRFDYYLAYFL